MMHTGTMTARWRRIVLNRQPASVSSCLTQSRLSSGSRKPSANCSQRSGPGSPGILAIVTSLSMPRPAASPDATAVARPDAPLVRDPADRLPRRDGLADSDAQLGDRSVLVRTERLLHLHRLEHDDGLAGGHLLPLRGDDLDDGALHGACEYIAVGGAVRAGSAAAARPPSHPAVIRTGGPNARSARGLQAEARGNRHLEP